MQRKVSDFIIKYDLQCSAEHRALDLMSEVGEISKEILKMSNYGKLDRLQYRKEVEDELGDAFFSLIAIANCFDISLTGMLDKTLEKYEKRVVENGQANSNASMKA
jgi:NTP pyrophosphatase (non-canonical NTP hydrolase)